MYVEHLEELYGLPAYTFPESGDDSPLPEAGAVAWRIAGHDWDKVKEEFDDAFDRFGASVDLSEVRALILGRWGQAYEHPADGALERLLALKDRLTGLEALFIGDFAQDEEEISWINLCDISPVFEAFPGLRELGVRGGSGLELPAVRHARLRKLWFQAGGLPAAVVRGVGGSELPELEHLELWLGVPEYGGDTEPADLAPLLSGSGFPRLRHLGLRNSEIQDEIAAAVAAAPVVPRLTSLDLSLGVLTDVGGAALLDGQPLTHLTSLDLHHNYLSDAVADRIRRSLEAAGVRVDVSADDADEDVDDDGTVYRYTAVAE
ncbi:STM4015 family protein [Streptomyces sp. NPDC050504]|uniref:STM4015 family protein n=1 Tax=Streptomyces sp. NPDC050504 TaxID=3365618 RepID=UPI00379839D2